MLDFKRRELRRRGELIDVEPQVFDLLTYLIRHRDRVVSKDDLLDGVWGSRIVSDSALTARMSALRRALGDNGETQRFIRTFPRKGVRFVAEVHETLEDGQPNSDRHAGRTPVVQAVLPLPDSRRSPFCRSPLRAAIPSRSSWPTASRKTLSLPFRAIPRCSSSPVTPASPTRGARSR